MKKILLEILVAFLTIFIMIFLVMEVNAGISPDSSIKKLSQVKQTSDLANLALNNRDYFFSHSIKDFLKLKLVDGGSAVLYKNGICLYHTQSSLKVNSEYVKHVVDISGSTLKVDGKKVDLTAKEKTNVLEAAYIMNYCYNLNKTYLPGLPNYGVKAKGEKKNTPVRNALAKAVLKLMSIDELKDFAKSAEISRYHAADADLVAKAEDYAKKFKDAAKNEPEKIYDSPENYVTIDGKKYLGPFKFKKNDYTFDKITLSIDGGSETKINKIYKISGETATEYSVTSGNLNNKEFYIKVNADDSEIKYKVKSYFSADIVGIRARLVLTYNKGNKGQDEGFFATYGAGDLDEKTATITWEGEAEPDDGTLIITKRDFDTNDPLIGAKFRITCEENGYDEEFEITKIKSVNIDGTKYKVGYLAVNNLEPGKYKIQETKVPEGYIKDYQAIATDPIEVQIDAGDKVYKHFTNRLFGNLVIFKGYKNKDILLGEGFKFRLYKKLEDGTKQYIKYYGQNEFEFVSESSANDSKCIFTTGNNSIAQLAMIPIGTYYIEEYDIPDNLKPYYNMPKDENGNKKDLEVYVTAYMNASFDVYAINVLAQAFSSDNVEAIIKDWDEEKLALCMYNLINYSDESQYITSIQSASTSVKNSINEIKEDLLEQGRDDGDEYDFLALQNAIETTIKIYRKTNSGDGGFGGGSLFKRMEDYILKKYEEDTGKKKESIISDRMLKVYFYRYLGISAKIFENEPKTGSLKIIKEDYDTKERIAGAKFRITSKLDESDPRYYNKTVTIPESGELVVNGLPIGDYTITEIAAGESSTDKYNIKLQKPNTWEVTIEEDKTTQKNIGNRLYGDLEVEKVDLYKSNDPSFSGDDLHKLENMVFDNAEFKIYYIDPDDTSNTKHYIKNFVEKTDEPSQYDTTSNKSEAQVFITNQDAKFELKNIPNYYTYYLEEIKVKDEMGQYYDVMKDPMEVHLQNNYDGTDVPRKTYIKFKNQQVRVDLQGYVWEDVISAKEGRLNSYCATDLHDELDEYVDSNDRMVEGIPVTLKKDGVAIAERTTNSNGLYFFPAKGTYNVDGTGTEYTIDLFENESDKLEVTNIGKGLSHYIIEFEYNGLKYQCVAFPEAITRDTYWSRAQSSKALETIEDRTRINENFNVIQGGNIKGSQTQGSTGTGVGLTYDSGDNYDSYLVSKTSYPADTLNGYVNPIDRATIIASTATSEFNIQNQWKVGTRTIRNINLGIYEREQPDLAIATDLADMKLTINGYSHTYKYGQRPGVGDNQNTVSPLDAYAFNVQIKNSNGNYKNMSYTRGIYDSYIAYTGKLDAGNDNRLRVFVTYKIAVRNESATLREKVMLKNYADPKFTFDSSYYLDESNQQHSLKWSQIDSGVWHIDDSNYDYKISSVNTNQNVMNIYLTYELSRDAIVSLASATGELNIDKNVTEIESYSSFDKDLNIYGGIDSDSAPDNANYAELKGENRSTLEDDTDLAPDLKISRKASKEIKGLVFEDAIEGTNTAELMTNQERKGNGEYEAGKDKKVNNVEVKIFSKNDTSTPIKLYDLDSNGVSNESDAVIKTGQNGQAGEYTFKGLVPGEYYIQYSYGNKGGDGSETVVVDDSGNISKYVTTQEYKSTIVNRGTFEQLINNNIEIMEGNDGNYNLFINNSNITTDGSILYWYRKNENYNRSSAVDDSRIRATINSNLSTINYTKESKYNDKTTTDNKYITANTGFMVWAIEDYENEQSEFGVHASDDKVEYQIKFGIAERPRQSVKVSKEVSWLSILLANGNSLAQGDPRVQGSMNYLSYPPDGRLKIEIDNEIIQNSNLGLRYEIKVENKSELDYDEVKYYRYGEHDGEAVKLQLDAIVDHVDEKLSIRGFKATDELYNNETYKYQDYSGTTTQNMWQIITNYPSGSTSIAGTEIMKDAYDAIKSRKNVVVLNPSDNTIAPTGEKTFTLVAEKLLTNLVNDEQVFDNNTELLQVYNSVGRFYGEMNESEWTLRTPGNFVNQKVDNNYKSHECDDNEFIRAQVVIVPPTGLDKNSIVLYSVITLGVLVILASGIVIIKRKNSK